MAKTNQLVENIRKILKEDTQGLTIQEIANKTKVSRITASIALARLEGSEKIRIRILGNCKLHYLKEK